MSKPDDTPQLNVTVTGPWGPDVKQVPADTNRLTPAGEFHRGWSELLGLPPSPADTLLQAALFVGMGAFPTSVLLSIPPSPVVLVPVALAVVALAAVAGFAASNPRMKLALAYRLFLILLGVALGVVTL